MLTNPLAVGLASGKLNICVLPVEEILKSNPETPVVRN